ncbi:MAG: hypothetical protein QOH99_877 [Frankiaceae bacterium]|jgi:threonine dehydrogenase-like Zn-dependent dehydrogenase|nr:hypothetical protein [Frankiaceae bacterium]
MGHEYTGIVEEVGSAVTTIKPGQFVIGSFFASDNTREVCLAGYQTSCIHRQVLGTSGAAQAQWMHVPLADGTLVATPDVPPADLVPSLLAASDVLGTGWFGAVAAVPAPARGGRRGLPGHGRTQSYQGPPQAVSDPPTARSAQRPRTNDRADGADLTRGR